MPLNTLHEYRDHILDVGAERLEPGVWQGIFRIEKGGATIQRGAAPGTGATDRIAEGLALIEAQRRLNELLKA